MALPCDGHLPNGGPRIKALSYMVARDISIINGCLPFVYMYFSDQFSNVMEDEHVHNETEDDQDDEVLLEYDDKKHAETMEANTDNSSRTDDGTLTTIKTARDNARRIFLESDPCPLVATCQESIQTKSSKKGNETIETVNRESIAKPSVRKCTTYLRK